MEIDTAKQESYSVPAIEAPVLCSPDLCVVGGGPAGVAAAVAAGRLGLDVLLLEKYGFCGGATVAGMSGTICGLHSSGDRPHQIVFGFADEFYRRLSAAGGAGDPVHFARTALVPHDSFVWKETADGFLQEAGVRVLYHATFLDAFLGEDGSVDALLINLLDGRCVVRPRIVIDASGDACVVHAAGGRSSLGKDGVVQTPTMIFRLGGVDMEAFLRLDPDTICDAVGQAAASGAYRLPRTHVYIFPMPNHREVLCNMTRITYPDGRVPLGISSADMTFAEMEGRRQAREYARFLRDRIPAFEASYIVDTGAQVGIRQTRSIEAKQRLGNDDVMQARKWDGAVTHSAWPIEAHGAGELKIVSLDNDYYDVPFETLIPRNLPGVLAAGRCLSAEYEALASARVTAQCFGMGYGAGAAAGLMIHERITADKLSGAQVTMWMKANRLKTAKET